MYDEGLGVRADAAEAARWFHKCTVHGDAWSLLANLALLGKMPYWKPLWIGSLVIVGSLLVYVRRCGL
jgi:TPR repeat protein